MKGKKIATRNKISIYYTEAEGYSVYAPDGTCLGRGYCHFSTAEKYCLSNKTYVKKGNIAK